MIPIDKLIENLEEMRTEIKEKYPINYTETLDEVIFILNAMKQWKI